MMEIQNLFSLHKVTIHGKELKLKDFPDTADAGVPDKVPDIPAVLTIKYVLGKKELGIHWDNANPYKKTFVVRVEHVTGLLPLCKTTKNSTKVDVTSIDTTRSSLFTVKVTVQTGEDNITKEQWDAMKGQTIDFRNEDVTINKYRMNPSHSLYPIDKFRLEICDKYKTIYDLFALFPELENEKFLESSADISNRLNTLMAGGAVPWEYLKIPVSWNTLEYRRKVLVILQKAIPPAQSMQAKVDSLYYADIINKPYAIDPAKGGSQRMTGAKRPYHALTTIPTQLDSTFVNRGNQYKAEQIKKIINTSTWKNSQKYFKKNSVVYGKEFHEFIYLDNRLEREACDTLRRIDRLLRLSKERGHPVLNKDVAAPYNYSTNTSTHRYTTFGVNNYDRTQSYPPVQPAPLIMAAEEDGESTSVKVEDSQPPFDRRDMVKRTKLVKVLKVNTGNNDIYYNHPLYRSKEKKNSNDDIQSYGGPPPSPPPPLGPPPPPPLGPKRRLTQPRLTKEEVKTKIRLLQEEIANLEQSNNLNDLVKIFTNLSEIIKLQIFSSDNAKLKELLEEQLLLVQKALKLIKEAAPNAKMYKSVKASLDLDLELSKKQKAFEPQVTKFDNSMDVIGEEFRRIRRKIEEINAKDPQLYKLMAERRKLMEQFDELANQSNPDDDEIQKQLGELSRKIGEKTDQIDEEEKKKSV